MFMTYDSLRENQVNGSPPAESRGHVLAGEAAPSFVSCCIAECGYDVFIKEFLWRQFVNKRYKLIIIMTIILNIIMKNNK